MERGGQWTDRVQWTAVRTSPCSWYYSASCDSARRQDGQATPSFSSGTVHVQCVAYSDTLNGTVLD